MTILAELEAAGHTVTLDGRRLRICPSVPPGLDAEIKECLAALVTEVRQRTLPPEPETNTPTLLDYYPSMPPPDLVARVIREVRAAGNTESAKWRRAFSEWLDRQEDATHTDWARLCFKAFSNEWDRQQPMPPLLAATQDLGLVVKTFDAVWLYADGKEVRI